MKASKIKSYKLDELKILVVENQLLMRRLLMDVLRQLGVKDIDSVGNVEDAYDLFKDKEYDLVITDWCPSLNGAALTRRMRTAPDSPNWFVPIILISAYTDIQRVFMARDMGTTEFLCKPVTASLVYRRICAVITNYRLFIRSGAFFGPDRRRRRVELSRPCRRILKVREAERRQTQVPFLHTEQREGFPGFIAKESRSQQEQDDDVIFFD